MRIALYALEARSELNMLNEFDESVWIARRVGVGWSDEDQWRAAKIEMDSLRKMLNVESFPRTTSPMKPLENLGTQNPRPSLLASDQISNTAASALHSSASKRRTPSRRSTESANQRRSSRTRLLI